MITGDPALLKCETPSNGRGWTPVELCRCGDAVLCVLLVLTRKRFLGMQSFDCLCESEAGSRSMCNLIPTYQSRYSTVHT